VSMPTPGAGTTRPLPVPEPGAPSCAQWVVDHLGDLVADPLGPSRRWRGGQDAAEAHLREVVLAGYASRRNEVHPPSRRGATGLSPYLRHGLLTLARVWDHAKQAPARDAAKFRDELAWQEYARHLYARLGAANGSSLRHAVAERTPDPPVAPPGTGTMACMDLVVGELADDGWLVNQTRMWLASHWSVRHGLGWRDGEDWLFARLLDGSRAANRLGWQWTAGAATGRPYGFSRNQVENRAPGLCDRCELRNRCPVADYPDAPPPPAVEPPDGLGPINAATGLAGPREPGWEPANAATPDVSPAAVWLTAESLGTQDPAALAHPGVPVVFTFDAELLARLHLTGMRLVFIAETLAEWATHRSIEVFLGDPVAAIAGRPVAVTHAPVPGFARHLRRRSAAGDATEVHPWPWLVRPGTGSLRSFSAWRRGAALP